MFYSIFSLKAERGAESRWSGAVCITARVYRAILGRS